MEQQQQQQKQSSYISTNKLIDEFKKHKLIKDDDKQLNIFFDNWNESNKFKNCFSIRILSFVVVSSDNKTRRITFKDFSELLPNIRNINIGKQISRDMRKIRTAGCRCVFVSLNQVMNKEYSYYPLKLSTRDYSNLYSKLREERSQCIGAKPEFIEDLDPDAF